MSTTIANRLEFIGRVEQVKLIRMFLQGEPNEDGSRNFMDLNNFIKMPEQLVNLSKSTNLSDPSDWAQKNWGTTYNALDTKLMSENVILFDTMNSEVQELVKILGKKFPETKIIYEWDDGVSESLMFLFKGDVEYFKSAKEFHAKYGKPENWKKNNKESDGFELLSVCSN